MRVGSLGDIVFEASADGGRVVTPQTFSRERKARYEEHKVIGAEPRLEFLAPELATVSLSIHLRVDMGVNPMDEADRIELLCREGKAHRLIISGSNFGLYVVESMSQRIVHASGREVLSVDLSLNLKEYF